MIDEIATTSPPASVGPAVLVFALAMVAAALLIMTYVWKSILLVVSEQHSTEQPVLIAHARKMIALNEMLPEIATFSPSLNVPESEETVGQGADNRVLPTWNVL